MLRIARMMSVLAVSGLAYMAGTAQAAPAASAASAEELLRELSVKGQGIARPALDELQRAVVLKAASAFKAAPPGGEVSAAWQSLAVEVGHLFPSAMRQKLAQQLNKQCTEDFIKKASVPDILRIAQALAELGDEWKAVGLVQGLASSPDRLGRLDPDGLATVADLLKSPVARQDSQVAVWLRVKPYLASPDMTRKVSLRAWALLTEVAPALTDGDRMQWAAALTSAYSGSDIGAVDLANIHKALHDLVHLDAGKFVADWFAKSKVWRNWSASELVATIGALGDRKEEGIMLAPTRAKIAEGITSRLAEADFVASMDAFLCYRLLWRLRKDLTDEQTGQWQATIRKRFVVGAVAEDELKWVVRALDVVSPGAGCPFAQKWLEHNPQWKESSLRGLETMLRLLGDAPDAKARDMLLARADAILTAGPRPLWVDASAWPGIAKSYTTDAAKERVAGSLHKLYAGRELEQEELTSVATALASLSQAEALAFLDESVTDRQIAEMGGEDIQDLLPLYGRLKGPDRRMDLLAKWLERQVAAKSRLTPKTLSTIPPNIPKEGLSDAAKERVAGALHKLYAGRELEPQELTPVAKLLTSLSQAEALAFLGESVTDRQITAMGEEDIQTLLPLYGRVKAQDKVIGLLTKWLERQVAAKSRLTPKTLSAIAEALPKKGPSDPAKEHVADLLQKLNAGRELEPKELVSVATSVTSLSEAQALALLNQFVTDRQIAAMREEDLRTLLPLYKRLEIRDKLMDLLAKWLEQRLAAGSRLTPETLSAIAKNLPKEGPSDAARQRVADVLNKLNAKHELDPNELVPVATALTSLSEAQALAFLGESVTDSRIAVMREEDIRTLLPLYVQLKAPDKLMDLLAKWLEQRLAAKSQLMPETLSAIAKNIPKEGPSGAARQRVADVLHKISAGRELEPKELVSVATALTSLSGAEASAFIGESVTDSRIAAMDEVDIRAMMPLYGRLNASDKLMDLVVKWLERRVAAKSPLRPDTLSAIALNAPKGGEFDPAKERAAGLVHTLYAGRELKPKEFASVADALARLSEARALAFLGEWVTDSRIAALNEGDIRALMPLYGRLKAQDRFLDLLAKWLERRVASKSPLTPEILSAIAQNAPRSGDLDPAKERVGALLHKLYAGRELKPKELISVAGSLTRLSQTEASAFLGESVTEPRMAAMSEEDIQSLLPLYGGVKAQDKVIDLLAKWLERRLAAKSPLKPETLLEIAKNAPKEGECDAAKERAAGFLYKLYAGRELTLKELTSVAAALTSLSQAEALVFLGESVTDRKMGAMGEEEIRVLLPLYKRLNAQDKFMDLLANWLERANAGDSPLKPGTLGSVALNMPEEGTPPRVIRQAALGMLRVCVTDPASMVVVANNVNAVARRLSEEMTSAERMVWADNIWLYLKPDAGAAKRALEMLSPGGEALAKINADTLRQKNVFPAAPGETPGNPPAVLDSQWLRLVAELSLLGASRSVNLDGPVVGPDSAGDSAQLARQLDGLSLTASSKSRSQGGEALFRSLIAACRDHQAQSLLRCARRGYWLRSFGVDMPQAAKDSLEAAAYVGADAAAVKAAAEALLADQRLKPDERVQGVLHLIMAHAALAGDSPDIGPARKHLAAAAESRGVPEADLCDLRLRTACEALAASPAESRADAVAQCLKDASSLEYVDAATIASLRRVIASAGRDQPDLVHRLLSQCLLACGDLPSMHAVQRLRTDLFASHKRWAEARSAAALEAMLAGRLPQGPMDALERLSSFGQEAPAKPEEALGTWLKVDQWRKLVPSPIDPELAQSAAQLAKGVPPKNSRGAAWLMLIQGQTKPALEAFHALLASAPTSGRGIANAMDDLAVAGALACNDPTSMCGFEKWLASGKDAPAEAENPVAVLARCEKALASPAAPPSSQPASGAALYGGLPVQERAKLAVKVLELQDARASRWAGLAAENGQAGLAGRMAALAVQSPSSDEAARNVAHDVLFRLVSAGSTENAVAVLKSASQQSDDSGRRSILLRELARLSFNAQDHAGCVQALDQADALQAPAGIEGVFCGFMKSMSLIAIERYDKAVECLESLKKLTGGDSEADARRMFLIGWVYLKTDKPKEAKRVMEEAVRLYPESAFAQKAKEIAGKLK